MTSSSTSMETTSAPPNDEIEAEGELVDLVTRTAAFLPRKTDHRGVSIERAAIVLGLTEDYIRKMCTRAGKNRLTRAPGGVTRESLAAEIQRRGIRLLHPAAA